MGTLLGVFEDIQNGENVFIWKHGHDDYEAWWILNYYDLPDLYDEVKLYEFFSEHDTEGCSIRGSYQEIMDEIFKRED